MVRIFFPGFFNDLIFFIQIAYKSPQIMTLGQNNMAQFLLNVVYFDTYCSFCFLNEEWIIMKEYSS